MSKKNRKGSRDDGERIDLERAGGGEAFGHNPFASLGALRDQLPGAERPPEPEPDAPSAAGSKASSDARLSSRASGTSRSAGDGSARSRSAKAASAKPAKGDVLVRRERKGRRGKTVTLIEGLLLDAAALDALMRELKRALGCGASIEDGAIVLQGEQSERALAALHARGHRSARAAN